MGGSYGIRQPLILMVLESPRPLMLWEAAENHASFAPVHKQASRLTTISGSQKGFIL